MNTDGSFVDSTIDEFNNMSMCSANGGNDDRPPSLQLLSKSVPIQQQQRRSALQQQFQPAVPHAPFLGSTPTTHHQQRIPMMQLSETDGAPTGTINNKEVYGSLRDSQAVAHSFLRPGSSNRKLTRTTDAGIASSAPVHHRRSNGSTTGILGGGLSIQERMEQKRRQSATKTPIGSSPLSIADRLLPPQNVPKQSISTSAPYATVGGGLASMLAAETCSTTQQQSDGFGVLRNDSNCSIRNNDAAAATTQQQQNQLLSSSPHISYLDQQQQQAPLSKSLTGLGILRQRVHTTSLSNANGTHVNGSTDGQPPNVLSEQPQPNYAAVSSAIPSTAAASESTVSQHFFLPPAQQRQQPQQSTYNTTNTASGITSIMQQQSPHNSHRNSNNMSITNAASSGTNDDGDDPSSSTFVETAVFDLDDMD